MLSLRLKLAEFWTPNPHLNSSGIWNRSLPLLQLGPEVAMSVWGREQVVGDSWDIYLHKDSRALNTYAKIATLSTPISSEGFEKESPGKSEKPTVVITNEALLTNVLLWPTVPSFAICKGKY